MAIADIEDVIKDVKDGKMVIIVDDEDRENEGDVMIAAEKATPEAINFMARYARGLICLSLSEERVKELDLPLMVSDNTSPYNTAFTVSIEAKEGVTTGISAYDRAKTILTAIDPTRSRTTLRGRATYSPSWRGTAACSSGWATRKRRWTSRAWQGLSPRA